MVDRWTADGTEHAFKIFSHSQPNRKAKVSLNRYPVSGLRSPDPVKITLNKTFHKLDYSQLNESSVS